MPFRSAVISTELNKYAHFYFAVPQLSLMSQLTKWRTAPGHLKILIGGINKARLDMTQTKLSAMISGSKEFWPICTF
jgi:hypothetical protein